MFLQYMYLLKQDWYDKIIIVNLIVNITHSSQHGSVIRLQHLRKNIVKNIYVERLLCCRAKGVPLLSQQRLQNRASGVIFEMTVTSSGNDKDIINVYLKCWALWWKNINKEGTFLPDRLELYIPFHIDVKCPGINKLRKMV